MLAAFSHARRPHLLLVLGACLAMLVALWLYAASREHWGDARTVIFTVGPLVLGSIGLGVLALLVADVVRERRTRF
jgi:peptidoglycan/LPS O-acetylase OafA/YrhL